MARTARRRRPDRRRPARADRPAQRGGAGARPPRPLRVLAGDGGARRGLAVRAARRPRARPPAGVGGREGRHRRRRPRPSRAGRRRRRSRRGTTATRSSRTPPPPIEDPLLDAIAGVDALAVARRYYAELGHDVDAILARSDLHPRAGKDQHAFQMPRSCAAPTSARSATSSRRCAGCRRSCTSSATPSTTTASTSRCRGSCARTRTRSPPRPSRCCTAGGRATRCSSSGSPASTRAVAGHPRTARSRGATCSCSRRGCR